MYNISESGYSGGHGIGGGYGGGAGIMPTIALQGANTGGFSTMPVMMGGCNNGGFGGDGGWLGLLAILALTGRNGGGLFGGGNDGGCAVPTLISDNINGRFGQISDQISASAAAGISATNQASVIDAVRSVDANVCAGFLQTQKGFGDVALESCRDTGLIVNAINSNSNAINANVTQVGTQGLLAEMRTQAQISNCCCDLEREIMQNRFLNAQQTCEINANTNAGIQRIMDKMACNEIQDLRDKLAAERLASSQSAQNAYLVNTLAPRPVPSTPVFANAPMFTPTISAESFCGFGDTSFRRGGGCGSGCGGF